MKRRIIKLFAVIVFLAGMSLLLYPTVSDYMNRSKAKREVFDYIAEVGSVGDEEYERILDEAIAYNKRLAEASESVMSMTDVQRSEYESLLDITGTGIMGYIDIPKADIYLPIYHGSSEVVLQAGIGHIEGTSLPIGGESVHSMLSGHRGLPSAKLFTDIDKLSEGDCFTLHVLDEEYTYEVEKIEVVTPKEAENAVTIEKGRDRCTLMTCTPYGINTHRLLVRGKRTSLPDDVESAEVQAGARMVNNLYIIAVIEIPVLLVAVPVSASARRRRIKNNNSRGEHS